MFTPAGRQQLKDELVARARRDERVVAAALLGSSSTGEEDQWSDIDLALSLRLGQLDLAVEDWTAFMYTVHQAVHHLDVHWETTLYRVFLLQSTLQIDVSFWDSAAFVKAGPRFRLLFGDHPAEYTAEPMNRDALIGQSWLYLLHARSSLARGRLWQANHMIAGARDRILELACHRHELPADNARGVDELPAALRRRYSDMVPDALQEPALRAALGATTSGLMNEAQHVDQAVAERIKSTLNAIGSLPPGRGR